MIARRSVAISLVAAKNNTHTRLSFLIFICTFSFSKALIINGTSLGENSIDLDPTRRPWYMKGGTRRPFPARRARNTGRRLAQLWPEENAYDDRVTNQVIIVIKN